MKHRNVTQSLCPLSFVAIITFDERQPGLNSETEGKLKSSTY